MHLFSTLNTGDTPLVFILGSTPTILATKPSKEESGADLELRNAISGAPAEYGADTVMQKEALACPGKEQEKWKAAATEELVTFQTREVYSVATSEQMKIRSGPAYAMCLDS